MLWVNFLIHLYQLFECNCSDLKVHKRACLSRLLKPDRSVRSFWLGIGPQSDLNESLNHSDQTLEEPPKTGYQSGSSGCKICCLYSDFLITQDKWLCDLKHSLIHFAFINSLPLPCIQYSRCGTLMLQVNFKFIQFLLLILF